MIKLIYCITKKPGMTDTAFHDHWERVHGPMAARIPGLRGLVQSRALRLRDDVRPADFDGVAELWFDDVEALLEARQSEAWRLCGLDEANFIDGTRVAYVVTEERAIVLPGVHPDDRDERGP